MIRPPYGYIGSSPTAALLTLDIFRALNPRVQIKRAKVVPRLSEQLHSVQTALNGRIGF
jgi:hypothetical protein